MPLEGSNGARSIISSSHLRIINFGYLGCHLVLSAYPGPRCLADRHERADWRALGVRAELGRNLVSFELSSASASYQSFRNKFSTSGRRMVTLECANTEMQENTWARLRESRMHQGASHAT